MRFWTGIFDWQAGIFLTGIFDRQVVRCLTGIFDRQAIIKYILRWVMFIKYIWPTSFIFNFFDEWLCFNKIVWIKSMNFSLQNFLVIFYTWTCSNPTKILSIVVHNLCITTWLLFIMLECCIPCTRHSIYL